MWLPRIEDRRGGVREILGLDHHLPAQVVGIGADLASARVPCCGCAKSWAPLVVVAQFGHAPVDPDRPTRCGQRLCLWRRARRRSTTTGPTSHGRSAHSTAHRAVHATAPAAPRSHRPALSGDRRGRTRAACSSDSGPPAAWTSTWASRAAAAPTDSVFAVLERFRAGASEISDRLLLSHTGPGRQPLVLCAPPSQPLIQQGRATFGLHAGGHRFLGGRVRCLHTLIPHPPAPVPLRQQQPLRTGRQAQPVVVTHLAGVVGQAHNATVAAGADNSATPVTVSGTAPILVAVAPARTELDVQRGPSTV